MIRSYSSKQLTLTEFDWPFETALDENNRWVRMSQCIPWDDLAEGYYQGLSAQTGRPAKDARLAIGAVIIKHKLSPIIRGKQNKEVEFGAKLSVSLTGDGFAQVDHVRWDAFHEGLDLKSQVESYKIRTGHYPEKVLADPFVRDTRK